jgi:hypothetical protein
MLMLHNMCVQAQENIDKAFDGLNSAYKERSLFRGRYVAGFVHRSRLTNLPLFRKMIWLSTTATRFPES